MQREPHVVAALRTGEEILAVDADGDLRRRIFCFLLGGSGLAGVRVGRHARRAGGGVVLRRARRQSDRGREEDGRAAMHRGCGSTRPAHAPASPKPFAARWVPT